MSASASGPADSSAESRGPDRLVRELERLWDRGQPPDPKSFLSAAGPASPAEVAAALEFDQWERWQRGEQLTAEYYLSLLPAEADDAWGLGLVYGEFLLREELGQEPRLDDYLRRFPQYADRLRRQVELHRALRPGSTSQPGAWSTSATTTLPGPSGPDASGTGGSLPQVAGFRVERELGRGGMGVVYQAWQ